MGYEITNRAALIDVQEALVIRETLGDKLRRLATAARTQAPINNKPLFAPVAWTSSAAITQGEVRTNGGNLYIAGTAGTTAASGGPTGSGSGSITDGTVTWHYLGVSEISADDPLAPEVSYSTTTPSGLTTLKTYVSDPNLFQVTGGTPTAPTNNAATQVCFPAVTVGAPGAVTGNVAITGTNRSNLGWAVTFWTNEPKFAVGTNNSSALVRLEIDGRPLTYGAVSYGAANPCWHVLDYTNRGGRKWRKVVMRGSGNLNFAGVRMTAVGKMRPPAASDLIRVACAGSSYTSGADGLPIIPGRAIAGIAAQLLGWEDTNLGVGGTGFIAKGPGNIYYNVNERLGDITGAPFDLVILEGLINDGASAPADITAAVLNAIQVIRAAKPLLPIIVMGAWPAATGPSAASIAAENAGAAAVTAFNDPLCWFIRIATDPTGPWTTGTGRVTAPNGTGSADTDINSGGTHFTYSAYVEGGKRLADAIADQVLPQPALFRVAA